MPEPNILYYLRNRAGVRRYSLAQAYESYEFYKAEQRGTITVATVWKYCRALRQAMEKEGKKPWDLATMVEVAVGLKKITVLPHMPKQKMRDSQETKGKGGLGTPFP